MLSGITMTQNRPAIKVGHGHTEKDAVKIMADQLQTLRQRGLTTTWAIYREPLNRTFDGYLNTQGPWGVFIIKRR
jgi:hypothetical protein